MHLNYEFVLEKCHQLAPRGRVVDFGCGGGQCVVAGRAQGLDIVGVDVYQADYLREMAAATGLLNTAILETSSDGILPLDDQLADLVFCNMVFEHVQNLRHALKEIARVLRSGGQLLALFPGKEVVWEAHLSLPFVHWFPKDSSLRYPYARTMRTLGLGAGRAGAPPAEWAREQLQWLDDYTFYRNGLEIASSLRAAGFVHEHMEEEYLSFRLRRRGLDTAARLATSALLSPISRALCRRYGTQVFLATKQSG